MSASPAFVLASGSPRRKELLGQLGLTFTVDPADADESVHRGEHPEASASRISLEKARTVQRRHPGEVVLAADTSVVIDDQILGKPTDDAHAAQMLKQLSGREHRVITAVAVLGKQGEQLETRVATAVRFRALGHSEIAWYVATGEGKDKAGGYASQARAGAFILSMDGSPTNVIGLPLNEAVELLDRAGVLPPWSKP